MKMHVHEMPKPLYSPMLKIDGQKHFFFLGGGSKNRPFHFENIFRGSKKLISFDCNIPVQPEQPVRLDSLDINVHNPRKLSFASRSLGVYTESCSANVVALGIGLAIPK